MPVTATPVGLTPGTVYHFRLFATNADGTSSGIDRSFRTTTVPAIDVIDAPCQGTDSALLVAQVKAGFEATATFHFEYGTTDQYGTSTADQIIDPAGGNVDKTIFAEISGLSPSTTYHFRGVAENSIGQVSTADQTFTTIAPGDPDPCALPDNRAYERVSPADKNGTDVERDSGAAALSGNAASFDSFGIAFDGATGNGLVSTYVGTRGSSGWSTQMVSPPIPSPGVLSTAVPYDYSPELQRFVGAAGIALAGSPPMSVRDSLGNFTEVSGGSPLDATSVGPTYGGASSDLTHIVFESPDLIPGTGAVGSNNVYEYTFSDGMVHLVSILPGETPSSGANTIGSGPPAPNAVSDDGSRIFWSGGGNLYLREDGTSSVQVDASQNSGPGGGGRFWTATPDGSHVFFTSPQALTDDATPGFGSDLYRYDVDTGQLTDLSVENNDAFGANVIGVLGASEDGNQVYFVTLNQLNPGDDAQLGASNLYVRDGSTTSFITTLQSFPPSCSTSGNGDMSDACNWDGNQDLKTSRVTPDGQTLLFTSKAPQPGGYDNAGFAQVYRFNLQDGLSCLSCNPSGAPATGNVRLAAGVGLLAEFGAMSLPERRNLSEDGDRAFFMSPEPLVNQDINEATDVYEWEQNGSLHLISSGRDPEGAQFSNASASGDDVFIASRKQLVPSDGDDNVDLYDARVDGGFPQQQVAPCVTAAQCKPPASGAPSTPGVGSQSFSGPGNQPKDTTPQQAKKKKQKKCKKIKNKKKRKKCFKKQKKHKKKKNRRAH